MLKVGKKLRRFRERAGLTLFELAVKSHVSSDYISRIELGKIKNIGVETLLKIANALQVSIHDLLSSGKYKQPKRVNELNLESK